MIPEHVMKQLSAKRTEYLKQRLQEMNIVMSQDHFAEVITPVQVSDDIYWNNYYLFYNDPKQMYLFTEKVGFEWKMEDGQDQPYLKQELYIDEKPVLKNQQN